MASNHKNSGMNRFYTFFVPVPEQFRAQLSNFFRVSLGENLHTRIVAHVALHACLAVGSIPEYAAVEEDHEQFIRRLLKDNLLLCVAAPDNVFPMTTLPLPLALFRVVLPAPLPTSMPRYVVVAMCDSNPTLPRSPALRLLIHTVKTERTGEHAIVLNRAIAKYTDEADAAYYTRIAFRVLLPMGVTCLASQHAKDLHGVVVNMLWVECRFNVDAVVPPGRCLNFYVVGPEEEFAANLDTAQLNMTTELCKLSLEPASMHRTRSILLQGNAKETRAETLQRHRKLGLVSIERIMHGKSSAVVSALMQEIGHNSYALFAVDVGLPPHPVALIPPLTSDKNGLYSMISTLADTLEGANASLAARSQSVADRWRGKTGHHTTWAGAAVTLVENNSIKCLGFVGAAPVKGSPQERMISGMTGRIALMRISLSSNAKISPRHARAVASIMNRQQHIHVEPKETLQERSHLLAYTYATSLASHISTFVMTKTETPESHALRITALLDVIIFDDELSQERHTASEKHAQELLGIIEEETVKKRKTAAATAKHRLRVTELVKLEEDRKAALRWRVCEFLAEGVQEAQDARNARQKADQLVMQAIDAEVAAEVAVAMACRAEMRRLDVAIRLFHLLTVKQTRLDVLRLKKVRQQKTVTDQQADIRSLVAKNNRLASAYNELKATTEQQLNAKVVELERMQGIIVTLQCANASLLVAYNQVVWRLQRMWVHMNAH